MKYDAPGLQDELARRSGLRVQVFLTNNRRRMVSARREAGGVVAVRLQRIFLDSGEDVLDDIAALITGKKTARTALKRFIDERFREDPDAATIAAVRPRRRPKAERSGSAHHDIAGYAEKLNTTYLGGRSKADVVWGRRSTRRSRRSIRFACYDPARNMIIMNRKLDAPDIPGYFVEYILFHEMLHEVLGIGARADGRRDIHGSLFKLMESTYPDFDKAQRYEKELCKRLGSLL